ncbi:MAG TPA: ATP-grasp domain-containing protein [Caldilinea sp.]|nr:ATP-grasp domain-containing protein [Anaerolineales bacterium]HRA65719.1 ATP-grasp domain-containing protein [Caldilinea sp.]
MPPTILCLASYFKGGAFLEECKRLGCHTILITTQKLEQEAWPRHAIDEFFMLPFPNLARQPDVTYAIAYLMRERAIDRIVALDDYDIEIGAELREHFRLPGMGASQARFFRDKLAMRTRARQMGVPVPDFTAVFHYPTVSDYFARTPGPWLLKPRAEASAMGIKQIHHPDELWRTLDELGDRQSYFLLEKFLHGDVFHVDSVVWDGEVSFAAAHRYGLPPMTVYHGGGVFASSTVAHGSEIEHALLAANRQVIAAMGLARGVTHAEFIRATEDGQTYFLEIAARVGGAGIDQLVEYASNLNPWVEWARVIVADLREEPYTLPPLRHDYAGLIVSLARQEWPDTAGYNDAELVWRLHKRHHVGFIVASSDHARVQALVSDYASRVAYDFNASAPPLDRPPE